MNKFAFMIHPLQLSDFTRKFKWMGKIPDFILEKLTKKIPSFKVSTITGIKSSQGKEIEGIFVACPLSSKQILELPLDLVLNKIIAAGRKAEELGAQILGLGSFTSVVGDKGETVANKLDIPVTTGNSYTVATAIQGTKIAATKMGLDINREKITVVGATGSIGRAVCLIMGKEIRNLQLVSRTEQKLRDLKNELKIKYPSLKVSYTTNVNEAVTQSRIIISASGAVETLIDPYDLLAGAVVCDVARPRDVANKVGKARNDVLVIEGGIVEVPGPVNFNFNFGCPPGTSYACMAETMLLSLENIFENYSLGSKIKPDQVWETQQFAEKHGFKLAGLRSFGSLMTEQEISQVRKNAQNKISASG